MKEIGAGFDELRWRVFSGRDVRGLEVRLQRKRALVAEDNRRQLLGRRRWSRGRRRAAGSSRDERREHEAAAEPGSNGISERIDTSRGGPFRR